MPTSTQQRSPATEAGGVRRRNWRSEAFYLALTGVVGYAFLTILNREIQAVLLVVAAVVCVVAVCALGYRSDRRADVLDALLVALRPVTGAETTARVSRWSGRVPGRVKIRYSPLAVDDSPDWHGRVLEILQRRLTQSFTVSTHDPRRRLLIVVESKAASDDTEEREVENRARAIIPKLLGSASLDVDVDADGKLQEITAKHSAGVRVAAAGYRLRVERAVSTMLPGRWKAHWNLTADQVTFRLRPTFPAIVPHPIEPLDETHLHKLPAGIDEDGRPVRWDLTAGGPHLLVSGKTGKGKTVLINGLVMEATRRAWPVWVADPKRIEFLGLRTWHNVQLVATSVRDILVLLKCAHDLMEERYAQIEDGTDESEFEPLIVVVDEYRNLTRQIDAWWAEVRAGTKGLPAKCPAYNWLPALAEKARSARIHLLVGTQRPDAAFLGEGLRDNFDTRFSLGPLSPQGAQMMWEAPYLGVAVPRNARGRGTARLEDESIDEVQVYWTPDPRRASSDADLQILDDLRPPTLTHPRLRVALGDAADLDGEELNGWQQVLEARLLPEDELPPDDVPTVPAPSVAEAASSLPEGDIPAPQPDELAADDEFGPETSIPASAIQAGDMVLVDADLWHWAAVEDAQEDLVSEEYICISWRDDDGDDGSLSIPDTESVTVRRPRTEIEEGE